MDAFAEGATAMALGTRWGVLASSLAKLTLVCCITAAVCLLGTAVIRGHIVNTPTPEEVKADAEAAKELKEHWEHINRCRSENGHPAAGFDGEVICLGVSGIWWTAGQRVP